MILWLTILSHKRCLPYYFLIPVYHLYFYEGSAFIVG